MCGSVISLWSRQIGIGAMQGYNDSHPVINGEKQQGFRMGFWRFRVEPGAADDTAPVTRIEGSRTEESRFAQHTIRVRQLEFIRATSNNTWGIGISEEGLIFGSTANGNPSNFMPIPIGITKGLKVVTHHAEK